MNQRTRWLVFLGSLGGLLLAGCSKPCQTTAQCGGSDVCAGAVCQALSCETAMFAQDPQTGECTALSGCYLTDAQRLWQTCSQDPCRGLSEGSCLDDRRCQPAYHNPEVKNAANSSGPFTGGGTRDSQPSCAIATGPQPGAFGGTAPGVNNGTRPKYQPNTSVSCFPNNVRAYAGCRAVPQITPQKACAQLTHDECSARRDCSTEPPNNSQPPGIFVPGGVQGSGSAPGNGGSAPPPLVGGLSDPIIPAPPQCFERFQRTTGTCDFANALGCLTNPACQAVGASCYCPPGGDCKCQGGDFLSCEPNDRLRRCQSAADCKGGERCDNDEACISPRTFASAPAASPVPGTGSCLGACVPTGCAGFGENYCNQHPECNAGVYATVCHPKPYCSGGGGGPPTPGPEGDPVAPNASGEPGTGSTCGCETEFSACAPETPAGTIRPERSLLVRDPAILDDPAFRIDNVISSLAPAGQEAAFVSGWMSQIGAPAKLPSGATAGTRQGFSLFLNDLKNRNQLTPAGLAQLFHTTSLVDRLDLASAGNCGEARVTFALNNAYSDGNQRMTVIVELSVPDDGQDCRLVAQQWGELSMLEDAGQRLERLKGIYKPLLMPAHLGQVRTNEFLSAKGSEPWELREWHLDAQGMLALAPVKQTVDAGIASGKVASAFPAWVKDNLAALKAGTAVIPPQYLAAASTENGGRVQLQGSATDPGLKAAEKTLNELACAGCHLTETKSPFVHVGERLGKMQGSRFIPSGRAVIDEFLSNDLGNRVKNLQRILTAPPAQGLLPGWRALIQARVH